MTNEQIWHTYKAVSEHQSLSQAARALNLSQSAVSQHVHQMEDDYGVRLLIRTSQGVELTDAGEIVYRDVIQLLNLLEESRLRVRLPDNQANRLAIGASLTIAEYVLPHALTHLTRDPHRLSVHMSNSQEVVDRVCHRDVDVGLIEAPLTHPELVSRPFLEDRLRLILSHSHPWADRQEITIEELQAEPLIIREPGSGTRAVLEDALDQVGIALNNLNVRLVLGTTQAIKAMIGARMGVSVLSPYTILPHERAAYRVLRIHELTLPRNFSVVYRHDLVHPPAQRFIRALFRLDWTDLLNAPS